MPFRPLFVLTSRASGEEGGAEDGDGVGGAESREGGDARGGDGRRGEEEVVQDLGGAQIGQEPG